MTDHNHDRRYPRDYRSLADYQTLMYDILDPFGNFVDSCTHEMLPDAQADYPSSCGYIYQRRSR